MVLSVAFQTQSHIVTSDSLRLAIALQLNGTALDIATEVKVAILGVSGVGNNRNQTLVIPAVTATYDATSQQWIADFTVAQLDQFLTTPTDPDSGLAYEKAVAIVQATGIGTLFSKDMTVAKGYIRP